MKVLRTPDECFQGITDYPFTPHYSQVGPIRFHYLDEGPRNGQVILLLHGEPSWSYLYRKMIPILTSAKLRVIAPDLPGFGRSDKPSMKEDYSFQNHNDWMLSFLKNLGLSNMTLLGQDWGGAIGLRIASQEPDIFDRIIASNTFLPRGVDETPSREWLAWRHQSQRMKVFLPSRVITMGCVKNPSQEVLEAYNAPYPDDSYTAGARVFPLLVPIQENDPASPACRKAWESLRQWKKPFLCAFSDSDPITRGLQILFRRTIPGSKGQPHTTIKNAGHFLQEDNGEELALVAKNFIL